MAYLTLDPSSKKMQALVIANLPEIQTILHRELRKLGVSGNDIIIKVLECNTIPDTVSDHVEIVMKTDSPKVDSPAVVAMLWSVFLKIPFEVTRIPCGFWVTEMLYEIYAFFITSRRRNWASNYPSPVE